MKTLELKLKKDVLIVEIPRLADYEFINRECKYLKVGNEEIKLNISTLDKLEFLCKGSELTEEIASELVNVIWTDRKHKLIKYKNYCNIRKGFFNDSYNSFISAVESKKFHWLENPIGEEPRSYSEVIEGVSPDELMENLKEWQEAEEKTFKNPLIFVKNYVQ